MNYQDLIFRCTYLRSIVSYLDIGSVKINFKKPASFPIDTSVYSYYNKLILLGKWCDGHYLWGPTSDRFAPYLFVKDVLLSKQESTQ